VPLTRRELIQTAAVAAPAISVLGSALAAPAAEGAQGDLGGKNIVLFITDQDRRVQHFPDGWSRENLPGATRLVDNGVTFENAFCSACMCSPSRSSMLTGYFPAQHGVRYTLEENMPSPQFPQEELPLHLKNMASVMAASGYDVVFKGKWHMTKPMNGEDFTPADIERYGFHRWNPPDSGANQSVSQEAGGVVDNDGRYMDSAGPAAEGEEGVLQYLQTRGQNGERPFFLIVSLVNPHDVLLYPKAYEDGGGYDDSWLQGEIELPDTWDESLDTKPSAQKAFRSIFALGSGPLPTPEMKRNYINFYGNLMKATDAYLVDVMNELDRLELTDDTLIVRTSDHGEMGMAHGGLRQKVFNAYEETLRVPLVFSNPTLYPKGRVSRDLVSHVDLLPTLAGLVGAPRAAQANWQGIDYSKSVLQPTVKVPQDHVVFTFDDVQCGQAHGPYVPAPGNIVSVREQRWKIVEYFDPRGVNDSQWELYDLHEDPTEKTNLAYKRYHRSPEQERQYVRMKRKLAQVQTTRLRPLPDAAFTVRALQVTDTGVTARVRVPGAGTLVQRVHREQGTRSIVVGGANVAVSAAGTVTITAALADAVEQLREDHGVRLLVRTSYLPGNGGADTEWGLVTAPQLSSSSSSGSTPAFTG
jgi:choline-sulfatase